MPPLTYYRHAPDFPPSGYLRTWVGVGPPIHHQAWVSEGQSQRMTVEEHYIDVGLHAVGLIASQITTLRRDRVTSVREGGEARGRTRARVRTRSQSDGYKVADRGYKYILGHPSLNARSSHRAKAQTSLKHWWSTTMMLSVLFSLLALIPSYLAIPAPQGRSLCISIGVEAVDDTDTSRSESLPS